MPAQSAPTIVGVTNKGFVKFLRNGKEYTYNVRVNKLDKVTLIAVAKFIGVTFTGRPPMHWTTEELNLAIANTLHVCPDELGDSPTPDFVPATEVDDVLETVRHALESARQTVIVDNSEDIQRIYARLDNQHASIVENSIQHGVLSQRVENVAGAVDGLMTNVTELSKRMDDLRPSVIELHLPERPVVVLDGIRHRQFAKVLAHVSIGNHLMMVGPAGTGKTTIAEQVAEALQVPFSCKSVTAQTSEAALLGYMSATGDYVTTEFRQRFEHGGVFLLDEVDAGNPNVLGVLNSALANSFVAFPDGMVKRHKDFVAIACGNTFGNGATAEYVGRNPLDKAFTDRFIFMDVEIDETIETAMVHGVGLDADVATRWLTFVRTVRKNVETHGLKVLVTPRGAFGGAKMIKTGAFTNEEIVSSAILKGVRPEQASKMLEGASF